MIHSLALRALFAFSFVEDARQSALAFDDEGDLCLVSIDGDGEGYEGVRPPERPDVCGRRHHEQPIPRRFPVEGLTVGPEKGALVIDGGSLGVNGANNFKRFVELAGGEQARIVIVPTAEPGGDTSVLDWMRKSFIEREFRAVLERGGAIGGSSAGATIQGSFLARGDTSGNTIMLGDHQRGFAYLKNAAIDQHVIARNRQMDLIEVLEDPEGKMEDGHARQSLLGLGIDEGSAVVVIGTQLEVIGKASGGALLYDQSSWPPQLPNKETFLLLGPGSKYDLSKRRVLKLVEPELPPTADG